MNSAPIGIFDSGLGGLTVAREIARRLPHESLLYVGDTARCPYGSRDIQEIEGYVLEIGHFLQRQQVKLMVIACNTATSYGLELARAHFRVPVLGVVCPGARAAVRATRSGRIAVIGTKGTVNSGAYHKAIAALDEGIEVFSQATPEFVDIVEAGFEKKMTEECVQTNGKLRELAKAYLQPLVDAGVDVLVLGCTHYPLIAEALQAVVGPNVTLISSATEVAHEAEELLYGSGQCAIEGGAVEGGASEDGVSEGGASEDGVSRQSQHSRHRFYTTGDDLVAFKRRGSRAFGADLGDVVHLDLDEGIC